MRKSRFNSSYLFFLRRRIIPVLMYAAFIYLISILTNQLIINFFGLREITVVGENIRLSINQNKMPKTVLFVPSEKLRQNLLSQNPGISDVKINRDFPHGLTITILTRQPQAVLRTKNRKVLISGDGTILGGIVDDYEYSSLPLFDFYWDDIGDGMTYPSGTISLVLDIIRKLNNSINITKAEFIDNNSLALFSKGGIVLIPAIGKNSETIASTLQTIMMRVRMDENTPVRIDLRYDKPVVSK